MRIAICPGSFDPVTKGHLNIIERSAKLFDAVTVLVMVNPNKTPSFTAQERADFLRRVTGHIPNVKVDVYTGLLAEYAHNVGACTIIKGLRAVTDFEFEFQQALTNKKLNPELETMFVITDRSHGSACFTGTLPGRWSIAARCTATAMRAGWWMNGSRECMPFTPTTTCV